MPSALRCGRQALIRSQKRAGRLNLTVQLPDYIIPQFYTHEATEAVDEEAKSLRGRRGPHLIVLMSDLVAIEFGGGKVSDEAEAWPINDLMETVSTVSQEYIWQERAHADNADEFPVESQRSEDDDTTSFPTIRGLDVYTTDGEAKKAARPSKALQEVSDLALARSPNLEAYSLRIGSELGPFHERVAIASNPDIPIGRSRAILQLEWQLLHHPNRRSLLLYGLAGIGKTTVTDFLGRWWVQTGLVERTIMIDLVRISFSDVIQMLKSSPESSRTLFIVDNLHVYSDTTINPATKSTPEMEQSWRQSLEAINTSSNYLLIVSRTEEAWLGLTNRRKFKLEGLTSYDAALFAATIFERFDQQQLLEDAEWGQYIDRMCCLLEFHPLYIKLFLEAMFEHGFFPLIADVERHLVTEQDGIT